MDIMSYIIVGFIGLIVGFIEIVSNFDSKATSVLSQKKTGTWAWGLIVFNGCVNILFFAVAMYLTEGWRPILLALIVGFGTPILMRTKFTVVKTLNSTNDLILNVGWIYDQIQKLCLTQIDNAILISKQHLKKILNRIPGRKQLYNLIYSTIQSNETLSPQEGEEKLKRADEYYKLANVDISFMKLSLLLLELEDWRLVERLEQMPQLETPKEELINRMIQALPKDTLEQVAKEVASEADTGLRSKPAASEETTRNFQKYIEDVMLEPVSDALKMAILANFIVDEGGKEFAQWTLERLTAQKDEVVYSLERKQKTSQ